MKHADAVLAEFLFKDSKDETRFVKGLVEEYHELKNKRASGGGDSKGNETKMASKDGHIAAVRAAIKALYLFWVDYQAYQTCDSEDELAASRVSIKKSIETRCKKDERMKSKMAYISFLYTDYGEYFIQNTQGSGELKEGVGLESSAFFFTLAKKGILLLGQDFTSLQNKAREFLATRKTAIFEGLGDFGKSIS